VGRPRRFRRVAIWVHGFNDYFFQAEYADRLAELGWDLLAVDLRRHGRSQDPGDEPGDIRSMDTFSEELGLALARAREDADAVAMIAHSMGGLAALSWVVSARPALDALVLDAPFLSLPGSRRRRALLRAAGALGQVAPRFIVQANGGPEYAYTLHRAFGRGGEWDYDLRWKRPGGVPIRAGFVGAAIRAQDALWGATVPVPALVLTSARSGSPPFGPDWFEADTVLDVARVRESARSLRGTIAMRSVSGALHDVLLSRRPARDAAWAEIAAFLPR
jgi:alpha-beta hydrolase superfamily lysophospholipase